MAVDSYARSSEDRALSCDGSGRWFDSSRAYRIHRADVAQPAERRSATPERPVRSGPSASQARGVTGSTASSNLASPGSNPGGFADARSSRAEAVRLSGEGGDPAERASNPARTEACGSGLHTTTATTQSAAGRNGFRLSILIDRSRVRVPPGALALR